MSDRMWFGGAGHFIGASSCRFHLHTHANGFCVSTVGDYRPTGSTEAQEIGSGRHYETMVFKLNADGGVGDWCELDAAAYDDPTAANLGHMEMLAHVEAGGVGKEQP